MWYGGEGNLILLSTTRSIPRKVHGIRTLGAKNAYVYFNTLQEMSRMWEHMWNVSIWHVNPTKTQISFGIRVVWAESSLSTWINFATFPFLYALSVDSRGLIWIYAGCTFHKVRFLMLQLICLRMFTFWNAIEMIHTNGNAGNAADTMHRHIINSNVSNYSSCKTL